MKMDSKKSLNSDIPSELDSCSNKENVPDDIIRIHETCFKNESEQQSSEISKKKQDVEDKQDYLHAVSKPKHYLQSKVLKRGKKQKLCYSSLKEKRKNMKQETVSVTKRQRTTSLRRRVLETMTKRKSLLEFNKSIEFPDKNKSESVKFQDKEQRNSEQKNKGAGNGILLSSATNSSFLEEFQSKSTPSNRFIKQIKDSSNKNQSSCSTQTASATASHDTTLKSEKEVWAHFISFLQNNNEEPSEILASDDRKDYIEASISTKHSLKDAAKEYTSQSLRKTVGTKTKYETPETLDTLKSEILPTQVGYSEYMTKNIQQLRIRMVKFLRLFEDLLIKRKIKVLCNRNIQMKIQYLTETQDKQKKLYLYYNILCDHQKFFDILQQDDSTTDIFLNLTCLTDLPLSAAHVKSLYLLFLHQHKSLYYETEIENIYKRINFDRFLYHRGMYMQRKEVFENQAKESENLAVKVSACFRVSLRECGVNMKREISHPRVKDLEDFQTYISDLKAAINANLNCLTELISVGSSAVFPVEKYLSDSRKRTLLDLHFLDKRRSDVFF